MLFVFAVRDMQFQDKQTITPQLIVWYAHDGAADHLVCWRANDTQAQSYNRKNFARNYRNRPIYEGKFADRNARHISAHVNFPITSLANEILQYHARILFRAINDFASTTLMRQRTGKDINFLLIYFDNRQHVCVCVNSPKVLQT